SVSSCSIKLDSIATPKRTKLSFISRGTLTLTLICSVKDHILPLNCERDCASQSSLRRHVRTRSHSRCECWGLGFCLCLRARVVQRAELLVHGVGRGRDAAALPRFADRR